MTFAPGTIFAGRYRIVALLGRRGMGEVFRAEDMKLGETVALKFLPESLVSHGEALELFHHEVKAARKIAHANVCRVHDIGEDQDVHYLTMEYIDGEDLASLLRRIGRLPQPKAIEIARQLCAGLAAAHERGVLHRDLKPANVMIDSRGRAKISDFGLAVLAGEHASGDTAGTPAYMAPEQLTRGQVSVQSDLYSLGLVLYEILTGERPFSGTTRAELEERLHSGPPRPPSGIVEGLDPNVEVVVQRCLEPDPRQRPRSALEVAARLPAAIPWLRRWRQERPRRRRW